MRIGFLPINKRKRAKLLIILLLAFAIVTAAAALTQNRISDASSKAVFSPIRAIYTEEKIYALTAIITGGEKDRDIELLLSVCEGLGVNVTFFTTPKWINSNKELAKRIARTGTLGLLIDKNINGKSRSYCLEYIASRNDSFFESSGKYAKFVRFTYHPDQTVTRVLNAYGQYCISYDGELNDESMGKITKGSIVDIGVIDGNSAFLLAQAVGSAISESMTCIKLDSFLYEIGSETDEYGKQHA